MRKYIKLFYLLIFVLITNYGSSQNIIDSLKIELQNPISTYDEINTLLTIGKEYTDINTDSALVYINKAEIELEIVPQPFLHGKYHHVYGQYLVRINKYNEAIIEHKNAIVHYTEIDSISHIPYLYNLIATSFKELISYDSALSYYNMSIQLTDTVKDKYLQASNYNNVALVYKGINQPEKALSFYQRALTIFLNLKRYKQAAITLNNIGIINRNIGNYEKAIRYFEEAIQYNKESDDVYNLCMSYNSIGTAYKDILDYEMASSYLKEAVRLSEESGFIGLVAKSSANLGVVFEGIPEFDSALLYYNKSLSICKKLGIVRGEIINSINMGNVYMKIGQYKDAETLFLKALELSKTSNFNYYLVDIYNSIFETYSLSGNYKKSVDYFKLYDALRDSLDKIETTNQLNELQTIYETEQKELENQLLKDENKISQLTIQRQRMVAILTIGIIIFLLLIAVILYLINRVRLIELKKQNEILEIDQKKQQFILQRTELNLKLKHQQVTSKVLLIAENEINFNKLADELYYFKTKLRSVGDRKKYESLINSYKKSSLKNPLEEFDVAFKSIYPDYNNKLLSKYPGLTPREMQICAMIRLNLHTKQIAALTNNSTKSIETARYRIRKKMNLNIHDNLTNELKAI